MKNYTNSLTRNDKEMITKGFIVTLSTMNNVACIRDFIDKHGYIPEIAYKEPYRTFFRSEIEKENERLMSLARTSMKFLKNKKTES